MGLVKIWIHTLVECIQSITWQTSSEYDLSELKMEILFVEMAMQQLQYENEFFLININIKYYNIY